MRSAIVVTVAGVISVASVVASPASAYEQRVHALLSTRAYHGAAKVARGDDAAAVRALRERIWRAGAEAKDPEVKRRFLARWPTLATFDSWSFKKLFALNPEKHVAGFDEDVALPAGEDGSAIYALASRLPDDDGRNRDRFRHDAQRNVLHDPWNQPLPDDPATLEMGSLTGLSSQAHAHYGLPALPFSDDPQVLKDDPRRFAIPRNVHTFGADFAESYTALAILAARLPGGERLALTHAGAAAHHLEDVANQIHTVQVGIYDFFVDAKIESIKEELRSVGGWLRTRPGFVSIGIDIISNHHVLAEGLYAKHLLVPSDPVAAETAVAPADDKLAASFAAMAPGCAPNFGYTLATTLIDRSSYEGPDVYRAIRAVALRKWSRAGQHFGENDDPDAALKPGADLHAFYRLEAAGARRALQTLDAWWAHFGACSTLDADGEARLAETLVRQRLDS
ncbi:MAG TPA: hypothetical protein VIA18_19545, partial [Polyangia bacterium]|nr:hypothetical protein [Polyangia bacterium]